MMRLVAMVWVCLMAVLTSAHNPTAGGGGGHKGFSLGIRDSIMIAHSFEGPQFGPAQEVRLFPQSADCFADLTPPKRDWGVTRVGPPTGDDKAWDAGVH